MNRSLFVVVLLLAVGPAGLAQRVLYSSQAINQPYQGAAIKRIRPHWLYSPIITVHYADGRQQKVARDSIWGYEDQRGRVYRYYKHTFYLVLGAKDVVTYNSPRPVGRAVVNVRYFSHDYDSPIRMTESKARLDSSQISQ